MSKMLTGEQIPAFRLRVLLRGLKLEIDTGMQLSRGRSCYTIIKSEFGLKGSKTKVYEQFKKMIEQSEVEP